MIKVKFEQKYVKFFLVTSRVVIVSTIAKSICIDCIGPDNLRKL